MMSIGFASLFSFLFLAALGFGLQGFIKPGQVLSLSQRICQTGTTGLVLVTVLTAVFVQVGIHPPFWLWSTAAFLSLLLGILSLRPSLSPQNQRMLGPMSAQKPVSFMGPEWPGIVALLAILVAGMGILGLGGISFHLLRGNGTDSFNYLTLAAALRHHSFPDIRIMDAQSLISQNPSFGLAKVLLIQRWSSGAVLAWLSQITGAEFVLISWLFAHLCLILSAGPCFLLARALGLDRWRSAAITTAILAGLWSQALVDMQALSHLHALPIAFLSVFLIIQAQGQPVLAWVRNGRFLLLLSSCALLLAYPELIALVLLGLILHCAWMAACGRIRLIQVLIDSLPLFCGYAVAFFICPSSIHSLKGQLEFAFGGSVDWHYAYVPWLFRDPLPGVWGLTHLGLGRIGSSTGTASPWHTIIWFISLILSLACGGFLFRVLRQRGSHSARSLVSAVIIAGMAPTLIFLFRQQGWATARGLSLLFPFYWLGAACTVFHGLGKDIQGKLKVPIRTLQLAGMVWIASQLWMGIARMAIAATRDDYEGYMLHHGLYRQSLWDLGPIMRALVKPSEDPITLITDNVWFLEYVSLSMGDKRPIRFAGELRDRAGNLLCSRSEAFHSRYLMVEKRLVLEDHTHARPPPLAASKDVLLFDLPRNGASSPFLAAAENPNGLERTPEGTPFLWLGGRTTTIWVAAPTDRTAILAGNWQLGPSLPEKSDRTLEVTNSDHGTASRVKIQRTSAGVSLQLRRGLNRFTLRVLDQPSLSSLPNGDTRPLLLGLWNPHLEPP